MPSPCELAQPDRLPETTEDQVAEFIYTSPWKRVIGFGSPALFTIPNAPLATETVTLTVRTHANLGPAQNYVNVWVNLHLGGLSDFIGKFFHNIGFASCVEISEQSIVISIALWNKWVQDAEDNVGSGPNGPPIITVDENLGNNGMACTSAGTNFSSVQIEVEYNAGDIISTPTGTLLWTEDLKANVLFQPAIDIPDEHLSAMPADYLPGYAMPYTVMPCRRVEELDEAEPNKFFYANVFIGDDGYARLEYKSLPAGDSYPEFRKSHYARAMTQNFPAIPPIPNPTQAEIDAERIKYGTDIRNIIDEGYAAFIGNYQAPWWIEVFYESSATICDTQV